MSPQREPDARTQALLSKVTAWVCHLCLDGADECCQAGCVFWRRARSSAEAPPALGHVVREQRQAAGLSLRDLAARCGMTAVKLGEIERGVSTPPVSVLARVFGNIEAVMPCERCGDPATGSAEIGGKTVQVCGTVCIDFLCAQTEVPRG